MGRMENPQRPLGLTPPKQEAQTDRLPAEYREIITQLDELSEAVNDLRDPARLHRALGSDWFRVSIAVTVASDALWLAKDLLMEPTPVGPSPPW